MQSASILQIADRGHISRCGKAGRENKSLQKLWMFNQHWHSLCGSFPQCNAQKPWEAPMKRRDFLKSMTAVAAGGMVSAPAVWSPAKAQSRQETLLFLTESGPNGFDIHGVGTNRPGYEVSWNCYDRLMSHGVKTLLRSRQVHARARRAMEGRRDVDDLQAAQECRLP
jgi:hypothetical protein